MQCLSPQRDRRLLRPVFSTGPRVSQRLCAGRQCGAAAAGRPRGAALRRAPGQQAAAPRAAQRGGPRRAGAARGLGHQPPTQLLAQGKHPVNSPRSTAPFRSPAPAPLRRVCGAAAPGWRTVHAVAGAAAEQRLPRGGQAGAQRAACRLLAAAGAAAGPARVCRHQRLGHQLHSRQVRARPRHAPSLSPFLASWVAAHQCASPLAPSSPGLAAGTTGPPRRQRPSCPLTAGLSHAASWPPWGLASRVRRHATLPQATQPASAAVHVSCACGAESSSTLLRVHAPPRAQALRRATAWPASRTTGLATWRCCPPARRCRCQRRAPRWWRCSRQGSRPPSVRARPRMPLTRAPRSLPASRLHRPARCAPRRACSTRRAALEQCGSLKRGETVLVTAAAGGTGQFAVQLARLAGCHVVATAGGPDKVALCKALGAHRVVDYKTEKLGVRLLGARRGTAPPAGSTPARRCARGPACRGCSRQQQAPWRRALPLRAGGAAARVPQGRGRGVRVGGRLLLPGRRQQPGTGRPAHHHRTHEPVQGEAGGARVLGGEWAGSGLAPVARILTVGALRVLLSRRTGGRPARTQGCQRSCCGSAPRWCVSLGAGLPESSPALRVLLRASRAVACACCPCWRAARLLPDSVPQAVPPAPGPPAGAVVHGPAQRGAGRAALCGAGGRAGGGGQAAGRQEHGQGERRRPEQQSTRAGAGHVRTSGGELRPCVAHAVATQVVVQVPSTLPTGAEPVGTTPSKL